MPGTAPLLVTRDDALLDDVLRLAAAAGVEIDVAHDADAALRGWPSAPLVLVGADLAGAVAARQPARRAPVHAVARGPAPDALFRAALALGARDVVELPGAEPWLVEVLADTAEGTTLSALTVAVVAGSGGAGATMLASAVAMTGAVAGPALLVDLDPLGPGAAHVVGVDDAEGRTSGSAVTWEALGQSRGRFGSASLRSALPCAGQLAVLGFGAGPVAAPEPGLVREVMSAAQRGNDLVVVDAPRWPDPPVAEALGRSDLVVVVAVPTVPSVTSSARVVARLRPVTSRLGLVLRGNDARLPAEHVAQALDVPLLVAVPDQRRVDEQVDLGLGPVRSRRGPLAAAARDVLTGLRARRAGAA